MLFNCKVMELNPILANTTPIQSKNTWLELGLLFFLYDEAMKSVKEDGEVWGNNNTLLIYMMLVNAFKTPAA